MGKVKLDKVKNILLTRTDRMGDVILSTPAIQAVREKFPNAFIALIVRPYTEPLVRHNPYIDEIIVYDKYGYHKKFLKTVFFAFSLKKKKFDISIMLHPTNRMHIVSFLAGIPVRIGYDRKLPFLLTHRVKHTKQFGSKHEIEYTKDMLKCLYVDKKKYPLTLKVPKKTDKFIQDYLQKTNLLNKKIIFIQPGASCKSKIWPKEKYVELIKNIQDKNKSDFYFIIIGDKDTFKIGKFIEKKAGYNVLNVCGKFSILQVAGLLRFSYVLISNDSGPVHIASALGVPVIAIFGRNQPGLSPKRWGPVSRASTFLHKDIGCIKCLAHNCEKKFKCINSIEPKEVLEALYELVQVF